MKKLLVHILEGQYKQKQFNLNINDMKKMNRSQSSHHNFKTLITEQDQQNFENKYAPNQNHAFKNIPNLISNSVFNPNKQNNSLFQSVSSPHIYSKQRDDLSQVDIFFNQLNQWKHKCKQYEYQIKKLHQERETVYQSDPNSSIKSNNVTNFKFYNYSEQFYLKQIQDLKIKLKGTQKLAEYKSSKKQETQLNNSEIQFKMQKDQKDQNLYIKELNINKIEIANLQERVKLLKGQNVTLRMYLQENGKRVEELQQKLGQVDMRKRKIQNYEHQIKEANQFLKDVEIRTQKLKQQTQLKDQIIQQKSISITQLQQTIESYEDKLRSIEQALIHISNDKKYIQNKNQHLVRECIQWKQTYEQLLRKNQTIQEMQFKFKTYSSIVQDLNQRNIELTSANQKYRINFCTFQKNLGKYAQVQRQMNRLKKDIKEKQQKINELQERLKIHIFFEQQCHKLRKEKGELQSKLQQKQKQNKNNQFLNQQLLSKVTSLQEEIGQIKQTISRSKQRSEKMDMLMKQNSKLNLFLMQKINQIQNWQFKLNNLQSKAANSTNQILKQKGIIEQRQEQIRQMEIEIEDSRNRYETEVNNRIQIEYKLVRAGQQILALKFNCGKLQEQMKEVQIEMQGTVAKHDQQMKKIQIVLLNFEQSKQQYQHLLNQYNKKIQIMKNQMNQYAQQIGLINKKEEDHIKQIFNLQVSLNSLLHQNQKIKQTNHQMFTKAQQIKQLSQNIMLMRII